MMPTRTRTTALPHPGHLLLAGALLCALGAAGPVRAEEKKELIEIPLIKKHKADMAAAAAAESSAAGKEGAKDGAKEGAKETAKEAPRKEAGKEGAKEGSESVQQLREALKVIGTPSKASAEGQTHLTLRSNGGGGASPGKSVAGQNLQSSRESAKARALALAQDEHAGHGGEVHWSYEGENGPQNWGKLKPEFSTCASGKRQSPIAIQSDATLQGPAEPLQFNYTPSRGSVVNNGHTIQVDVEGENTLTVRNSTYRLLQFHFHTPSEEMVNARRYPMVAHLVHKNEAGQLAVVAVLLDTGEANAFIDKVWTYMPLDTNDRVRVPEGLLDVNELLPKDQRYYQFMGSLTTPPCSEGVLWMVLKTPAKVSGAQYRLFRQLFPLNARPVQPVNGRAVREAN